MADRAADAAGVGGEAGWPPARALRPPAAGEVLCLRVALPGRPPAVADLAELDEPERARAARFRRPELAGDWARSHAALRRALAAVLGAEPRALRFETGEHEKPRLAEPAAGGLEFNLAHSGAWALVAIARDRPVGVDVERERESADDLAVARRFFAPGEVARLERVEGAERRRAFARCWTRKEAFLKACGRGLSLPLDRFEVTFEQGAPARLERLDVDLPEGRAWSLVDLAVAPGYAAALAVPGGRPRVVRAGWSG